MWNEDPGRLDSIIGPVILSTQTHWQGNLFQDILGIVTYTPCPPGPAM
jgi:hypothetical protein